MNNNFGISDKSFVLIKHTLASFDSVECAKIFGSRAKGNHKKGSDIDIAVYGDALTETEILALEAKFNESIPVPYKIDVLAPKFIDNQNLLDHIERVGVVFYEKVNGAEPVDGR